MQLDKYIQIEIFRIFNCNKIFYCFNCVLLRLYRAMQHFIVHYQTPQSWNNCTLYKLANLNGHPFTSHWKMTDIDL